MSATFPPPTPTDTGTLPPPRPAGTVYAPPPARRRPGQRPRRGRLGLARLRPEPREPHVSTQVRPFDVVSNAPEPSAPSGEHTDSPTRRARRLVGQLISSLTPVLMLAAAFALAGDRLAESTIAGVGLSSIIIAVAVVTPLLSQTVSSPIYAAIEGVDLHDRMRVSSAVIRVLPRGAAIALWIAVVVGAALAGFRSWGMTVGAVIVISLFLNLMMAMLMVTSFATRSVPRPAARLVAVRGSRSSSSRRRRGGCRRWSAPSPSSRCRCARRAG